MLLQRDSLVARSEVDRIHRLQDDIFTSGCIPWWIAGVGYAAFAALAIIVIPFLYTPVKWCDPDPLCAWRGQSEAVSGQSKEVSGC